MSFEDGYLPGFTWVDNPRTGGYYDPEGEGYPWRIVAHTIEGDNLPNVATHPYPPHVWYHRPTRTKLQTVNCLKSAYALYQDPLAPYYTNRARALQVEISGFASEAGSWPDSDLKNLAEDIFVPFIQFVRAQGADIDLSDLAIPLPGVIPNSATVDAAQRLSPIVWAFGPVGFVSHRHVPMGDDHWDTGLLDTRRIAYWIKQMLGTGPVPIPVPSDPRRLENVIFHPRPRNRDGQPWGFPSQVVFWDCAGVRAGMTATLHPVDDATNTFNVVPIITQADGTTQKLPAAAVSWGKPCRIPIKSDSIVTFVVPVGIDVDAQAA